MATTKGTIFRKTVGEIYDKRIEANVYLYYIMLECGHESLIGTWRNVRELRTELMRRRCMECMEIRTQERSMA